MKLKIKNNAFSMDSNKHIKYILFYLLPEKICLVSEFASGIADDSTANVRAFYMLDVLFQRVSTKKFRNKMAINEIQNV